MSDDVTQIVASFFERVRTARVFGRFSGTSYDEAVKSLMDAIGLTLSPDLYCLSQPANTGAGNPDFGLYAGDQLQQGEPRAGQPPTRGVIEMKGVADDRLFTSTPAQLTKYFGAYRLVIATNLRGFQIIGDGPDGKPVRLAV